MYFLYPETQGLSLEEIDGLFMKDGAAHEVGGDIMRERSQVEMKSSSVNHIDQVGNV